MRELLERIVKDCGETWREGTVATYIPELAKARPDAAGLSACDLSSGLFSAGDHSYAFTMQSVSKIVSLALALSTRGGDAVFSRVGMAPLADPFNSIMRLEMDTAHRPHNPLINSGAITVLSLLPWKDSSGRSAAVKDLASRMTGNPEIAVNEAVFASERATAARNRALAWFLRSVGTLDGDVEDILESYFCQCSLIATSDDLAVLGATLASGGRNPITGERVLAPEVAATMRTIMATCGMYDGSGEFAVLAGIPAKSGVGGGIAASVRGRMGIGTCGPSDGRGNSVAGVCMLSRFSRELDLRIY